MCGVSECDQEASIMRRPWPTRGCYAKGIYADSVQYNGGENEIFTGE
jgi:hypothetical protein